MNRQVTEHWLKRFEDTAEKCATNPDPMAEIMGDACESMAEDLRQQLAEDEADA